LKSQSFRDAGRRQAHGQESTSGSGVMDTRTLLIIGLGAIVLLLLGFWITP
jgi:hypothetical protein